MKSLLAGAVVAIVVLAPSFAAAQERADDAALGALSGAVVLGPVGAVAGAIVGYSAGPSIARSWGLRRGSRNARAVRPARSVTPAARPVRATSGKSPLQAAPAQVPGAPAQTGPRAQSIPPAQTFE
jgi:hypothetical protein